MKSFLLKLLCLLVLVVLCPRSSMLYAQDSEQKADSSEEKAAPEEREETTDEGGDTSGKADSSQESAADREVAAANEGAPEEDLPKEETRDLGEPIETEEEAPKEQQKAVDKPTPVAFLPPLSLRDCLTLIDRIQALLEKAEKDKDAATVPVDSLRRMVVGTYNYLTFRDDLHTSLANYEWIELEDAKVENELGEEDTDTFRFDPPIKYISALSFEVEDEDAFLHAIRVYDEDNKLRQSFKLDPPKQLHQHLPRREVFHLWRRTTISRIEVDYSRVHPNVEMKPSVLIRGGITEKKEYIKTAIYKLGLSLESINKREWKTAREQLQDAKENIMNFIRKNQGRR